MAAKLDIHGIFTTPTTFKKTPAVLIIPNFLSDAKCDEIRGWVSDKNNIHQNISKVEKGSVSSSFHLYPCKTYNLHANIVKRLRRVAEQRFHLPKLFATWEHPLFINQYRVGGCRGWHYDGYLIDPTGYGHPTKKEARLFFTKRLTSVVQLSDSDAYSGGNLKFFNYQDPRFFNPEIDAVIRKKGTAIIFLSYIWHEVETVRSGERLSLNLFLYEGES